MDIGIHNIVKIETRVDTHVSKARTVFHVRYLVVTDKHDVEFCIKLFSDDAPTDDRSMLNILTTPDNIYDDNKDAQP